MPRTVDGVGGRKGEQAAGEIACRLRPRGDRPDLELLVPALGREVREGEKRRDQERRDRRKHGIQAGEANGAVDTVGEI